MRAFNNEKFVKFCRKKIRERKINERIIGIYLITSAIFLGSLYNSLNPLIFYCIIFMFIFSFPFILYLINKKLKFPWKKDIKLHNEAFYNEIKEFFNNDFNKKYSFDKCNSWYSKAKIFDFIQGIGYYIGPFLLITYIAWLIEVTSIYFLTIYIERNSVFILNLLINIYLRFFLINLSFFVLFYIAELYINRLKYIIDDIIRVSYNDIEKEMNRIILFSEKIEQTDYKNLQKDIENEIFKIENLHSLNIFKILKKSDYKFKINNLYRQFRNGAKFDLIKIIEEYVRFIDYFINLNSQEKEFEYNEVFHNYINIFYNLREDIISKSKKWIIISKKDKFEFDLAFSLAGDDRKIVEKLYNALTKKNLRVFYDKPFEWDLVGKNLSDRFKDVYGKNSKYVVIFVSKNYPVKEWTNFEFQYARDEAKKRKEEFIIPIRLDNTILYGLKDTIGYFDYNKMGTRRITDLLNKKLQEFNKRF